ncbi:MAG: serine/threonine protein kinase [Ktedonobacterales bacterium]|nr:serine/threonine protein kinase [Ktedonobacterales bacterium]
MAQPALLMGAFLANRYRVDYLIATGGYASVYRVTDLTTGQPRAAKEVVDPDPAIREQFALEAQLLMRSRHPNIPHGYDHFNESGRAYLIMDFVEGQDLEQMLSQSMAQTGRPIDEVLALRWLLPICDALHEMHTQPIPIIHRDIKPANIKLTAAGVPVLIDFGLAKLGLMGPTNQAAQGVTPGYAPPEQYLAAGKTDARSDVYSMGATLYTLLAGREPPEAPNRLLSKSGHSGEPMVPARLVNPAISSATAHIIDKAMSMGASERYQTARELQDELASAVLQIEYGRKPTGFGAQTGPLPYIDPSLVPTQEIETTQQRPIVTAAVAVAQMDPSYTVPRSALPPFPEVPTRILPPGNQRGTAWFDLGGPLVQRMGKAGLVLSAVELYWGLLCAAALGGAVGTRGFKESPTVIVAIGAVVWLGAVIALTSFVVRAIDRPIARRGRISDGQRWFYAIALLMLWLGMNGVALFALGGVSPLAGLFGLGFLGLASILTGLLNAANVLA